MNLRDLLPLLSVAAALTLAACATTAPGPVPQQEADRAGRPDSRPGQVSEPRGPRDQLTASLPEIKALSQDTSMSYTDLAVSVLRALEPIPSGDLAGMIDRQEHDPEFTEWLELAILVRNVLVGGSSVAEAARNWENYHYGHAITRINFPAVVEAYGSAYAYPGQVAVLLPTDGPFAAAGRAIRDGILSAYLEQPGDSVIRFYSSGESDDSTFSAYARARQDGATQIIGPLSTESTRALARFGSHDVPVLLLNDPGTALNTNPGQQSMITSLSLSQNEEAEAIARRALVMEQARSIVIVPDNDWGQRIEDVFSRTFIEGGGQIMVSARFDPATSDHSAVLTQLLKIDESRLRKQALQSRLGMSLEFEPIRRDDFDFFFLAANPVQGRELKPLLRFHDAGDAPVYAMGRVYSGRDETGADQDLEGVIFPITPWQLEVAGTGIQPLESLRGGMFGNLYALGQDAWELLPWLPLLQKDPDLAFQGRAGALQLMKQDYFFRQPAWAQFSSGLPVPYRWPDPN